MRFEINRFINFIGIFKSLYSYHEEDLREHQYEAEHFKRILQFVEGDDFNKFDLELEECEFTNEKISFVFGCDFGDSNESNNQSTTANYHIVYDRVLSEFTVCDYEQG